MLEDKMPGFVITVCHRLSRHEATTRIKPDGEGLGDAVNADVAESRACSS